MTVGELKELLHGMSDLDVLGFSMGDDQTEMQQDMALSRKRILANIAKKSEGPRKQRKRE
jgi:hypothetical protein